MIARENEPAPGTGSGIVFATVERADPGFPDRYSINAFDPALRFNGTGQVAFLAHLGGLSVDVSNDTGIWALDGRNELQLITRTGQSFAVSATDTRTVSQLKLGNLNNRGELVFGVLFTDGTSGIFVTDTRAVPEGDSQALLAFAAAPLLLIHVKRRRSFPGIGCQICAIDSVENDRAIL